MDRELAAQLGYVRTLAEEGRNTPLVGGPFLVLLGIVLSAAYVLHWALVTEPSAHHMVSGTPACGSVSYSSRPRAGWS